MTAFNSEQIAAIVAKTTLYPIDWHGKFRMAKFDFVAAAAGSQPDIITLTKLPPGRIRVLPSYSRVWHTAFGATATLDLGLAAYKTEGFVTVAADEDAFAAAIDIAAAGDNITVSAVLHEFDVFSIAGVDVIGTVKVLDVAAADELHGYVAYLHE